MDYTEKMRRILEYVEALEEEKRKIQVFQRELPLCLELVTQAIETCKKELSGKTTEYMQGQSECSEQTSSDAPVLEEFIPLRRTSSVDEIDEQHSHDQADNCIDKKKSDWLRSVQLWNQSPDPPSKEDIPRKTTVLEVKKNGGAFQPFNREKSEGKAEQKANPCVPMAAASSTAETVSKSGGGGSNKREDKDGQSERKQRRCWSPELHRRFLHALQQLGGSHVATPKQIRELMKVDGLTNDEVKSHLQKYRLHTRRPSPTIHNNGNPQTPHFVVVGGIWVPPPEYAPVAAKASSGEAAIASTGIYAPVAAPPPALPKSSTSVIQRSQQTQSEQLQSEERGSLSEEEARHSNSPSTSSSTHTSTVSPAFN
ncbi:transcription factor HHO3-like [Mangifera indica]|uniref:transcription factor HHO3-like n=1 Tax=Mangifera indica TaxID=29780 RepID=UPI001CFA8BC4|nr:transcription factor HHO3-like [Mangifera indica]